MTDEALHGARGGAVPHGTASSGAFGPGGAFGAACGVSGCRVTCRVVRGSGGGAGNGGADVGSEH
jgi:hypothetical protein